MYPENRLFAEYETSCVQLLNLKKKKKSKNHSAYEEIKHMICNSVTTGLSIKTMTTYDVTFDDIIK